ncbi:MAG: SRPBCC family protein [Gallionellaceae bacterium]|nr:SRPBCC family protein [Gallionellaceae bacterium]
MPPIEANPEAPACASAEAYINAPVETVWTLLSDFAHWPDWNEAVARMRLDGPVQAGTPFVWVAGGTRIVSRLEEVAPPGRLAWTGKTMGIRAVHVWRLATQGEGTHVHTEESLDGLIARLLPGLMRKMLAKALAQGVMALKTEAEARHERTRG